MVKKILETFKTDAELEAYLQAQQQTLIESSKKISILEQENKKLRESADKLTAEKNAERSVYLKDQEYTDAEIICVNQIEMLKKMSEERSLTLEESKKLDTFVKVLDEVRSVDNKDGELKETPTEDLLRIVKSGSGSES